MNIDSKACKHVINNECMVQLVSFYIGVRGWGGFLCRHLKTKRHTSYVDFLYLVASVVDCFPILIEFNLP